MDRDNSKDSGVALALSGGGFRAALFHLGALKRLNELGWLHRLSCVSSVSGGSIIAALLGLQWDQLVFERAGAQRQHAPRYIALNLDALVSEPLLGFCAKLVDFPAWLLTPLAQPSPARALAWVYDCLLYRPAAAGLTPTLADLPDWQGAAPGRTPPPRFIFNAANLTTGSGVRISRGVISDYRLGWFTRDSLPLAQAVAASSAYPPVLSPLRITVKPDEWSTPSRRERELLADERRWSADAPRPPEARETAGPGERRRERSGQRGRRQLVLVDGGVRDNMGLEAVWRDYDVLLVSNAGYPLGPVGGVASDCYHQGMRSLAIKGSQGGSLRKQLLIAKFLDPSQPPRQGAYWATNSDPRNYKLEDSLVPQATLTTARLATLSTRLAGDPVPRRLPLLWRLNGIARGDRYRLVNWGYAIADTALRRWVEPEHTPAPECLPYPGCALVP